ncbi:hypothetical protein BCL79_2502 [Stenotrophomonas rhizophila]|uniref:Uncharacterized protein n=2 Tax=Lysobacteraceae TaxID=32033 RepID=A0A498CNX3_9GAMM|nr:hypothetical protein BCL79_2502 [Stenotrophomonas rhizophila]
MRIPRIVGVVGVVILASVPMVGMAQSDGHGTPLARSGLGQAQPMAVNLSQDPNWLVYGFQRDGISYFQVNDLAGRVQLIIGNTDDVFWTLPAGDGRARVSLPTQYVQHPTSAPRIELYRGPNFSLVRYGQGGDAVWAVEAADEQH